MDTCKNCGATIGNLEVGHVYRNNVVCDTCIAKLRRAERTDRAEPTPPHTPSPGVRFTDREANAKAGAVMVRVLFWIIAGLIILGLLSMISSV